MLTFTVITLFPEMFHSPLSASILKIAQQKKFVEIKLLQHRDFARDRHHVTDDYPYGGGQGMVMKPEPLVDAIEAARAMNPGAKVVLLSPQGKVFNQSMARRYSEQENIVLVCGRYEGIDERVKSFVDDEISVGDYTLSGGEPAAMVVIDAVTRLLPGVLGNENSPLDDSFSAGLLEYPQYTRPEIFRDLRVPEVLLSGDHRRIAAWRHEKSLEITRQRRPDLLTAIDATPELPDARAPVYVALLHYPVYDKNHQVVTTAVTNMDIHDIARSGRTYGVRGFFVVTPVKPLQKLAKKIIDHWEVGYGSRYNTTRKDALALVRVSDTYDDVLIEIERETGEKPIVVVTSARPSAGPTSFVALRDMLIKRTTPFVIIFGTGWGLTETIISSADYVLEPIEGGRDYNHLSVRAAAAIIMDRLLAHESDRSKQ